MTSELLTKGMLRYVVTNMSDDFVCPEVRLQVSRVRLLEKSEKTTVPRYRVMVTDGQDSIHSVITSETPILANQMITSSKYAIKNLSAKTIILFHEFQIQPDLLLPEIDPSHSCKRELKLTPKEEPGTSEHTSAAPAPVVSAPVSAPAAAPAYKAPVSGLPIVKQQLGQAAKPKSSGKPSGKKTTAVKNVTPYNNKWTMQVRVAQKSDIIHYQKKTTGKLFNVTFIDESGEIRATGFNEQVDMFYSKLEVGKVYFVSGCRVNPANKQFSKVDNDFELSLDRNTQIELCHSDANEIPFANYNFVPLDALPEVAANSIVDVIGVLSHIDEVSQINTKKGDPFDKRDITIVDDTGYSVRCTVWGKQASEFNTPLEKVVAVKAAKVSDFGGKSLSLFSSSSLVVDPEIPEGFALQGWYLSRGKEQSFQSMASTNTSAGGISASDNRITIETAKLENLGMSEKPDIFVIKATVSTIMTSGTMYYASCPDCNKKVIEDTSGSFTCEKCNKSVDKPIHRYVLSVCLNDETDQIWSSCFEETGSTILTVSADELHDAKMNDLNLYDHLTSKFPRLEYLFKIRAKQDIYNDNIRVRYSVIAVSPLNYVDEATRLLNELKMAN